MYIIKHGISILSNDNSALQCILCVQQSIGKLLTIHLLAKNNIAEMGLKLHKTNWK